MSPEWQPAAPDTIGLGYLPGGSGQKIISSPAQSLAWQFTADVTETVTEIMIPVSRIDADGLWIAEVYEDGGEVVSSSVTTSVYRPTGDELVGTAGDWEKQDASTTNLYQSVDGTTYDKSVYVTFTPFIPALPQLQELTFNYGTSTWPTGQRVTAIRLSVVASVADGSATFTGLADLAGGEYAFGGQAAVGSEVSTLTFELGEINPDTLLPWTAADVVALATTTSLGISGVTGLLPDNNLRIFQMWVEVDWVPENRLVVGVEQIITSSETGWITWSPLVNPNDNALTDWDKDATAAYVVALRNLGNSSELYNGTVRFPWVSDGEELPTGWGQSYLPIDATGLISVPFADFAVTRSTGIVFTVTTDGDSADGQPSTSVNGYVDAVTEQQITTLSGDTYGRLRFGWLDTTDLTGITPPAGDLTVKVLRQSDDVQFGSTETFTQAELQAGTLLGTGQVDPQGLNVTAALYLIERDFTTPPTLATTQYYVEFTGGHSIAVNQPPESATLPVTEYTAANVNGPSYLCLGPDGNVWFTSSDANYIGKITTAGTITTYTNAAFNYPVGICSGPDGNLWVTNLVGDSVCKVTTAGTVSATYTSGGNIDGPWGICSDGTNLWVANAVSSKVCKVTTAGVVTAYTDAGVNNPRGICFDGTDLWVAAVNSSTVSKVTTAGVFTNYTSALMANCLDICSGPDGNLWVTDQTGSRINQVTPAGVVTTFSSAQVNGSWGICSDGNVLWFGSYGNDRIGKITTTGEISTYTDVTIDGPYGMAIGADSNLWFANNVGDSIGKVSFDQTIGAEATYDGSNDALFVNVLRVDSDYPVTLSTIPDAPTGFDATATVTDLETATDTACGVDELDYISLTWTATALGSSFGHYEIQRDNGDALGFQTIAEITDETVEVASDYESIRGTISYRMRVCRSTDRICSDWTATQTAVRDAVGDALWLFTSNAYPDLTCAYNVTDQQTYGWPDAARQRIINHYGSDDKTRYVETERRLTQFPVDLTVYSQGLTSDGTLNLGVAPFFPLLELCSQTSAPGVAKTVTPYVAVIDPNGNSWYAAVTVETGSVLVSQSNAHVCPANIVQLTETPCPFDVDGGS